MKAEDVMKALECCLKAGNSGDCYKLGCPERLGNGLCFYEMDCENGSEEECLKKMLADALALLREKDEEIEMLKEMIDTSSDVVDYAVDKIREARASMLDEARRLSFEVGDQQYISIAELEKIAKGNAE